MGFLKIHVLRRTKMEIVILVLSLALVITVIWISRVSRELKQEQFRNRSLSSKYGKLTEQFLPLVNIFPWNPQNFRFLGTPVDGIQFEDNRIILVEFKTSQSQLSTSQRQIKDLVDKGKVSFELISIR